MSPLATKSVEQRYPYISNRFVFTDHPGTVEVAQRQTRPTSLRVQSLFPWFSTDSAASNRIASRPKRQTRQVGVVKFGFRPKGSTLCRADPTPSTRRHARGEIPRRLGAHSRRPLVERAQRPRRANGPRPGRPQKADDLTQGRGGGKAAAKHAGRDCPKPAIAQGRRRRHRLLYLPGLVEKTTPSKTAWQITPRRSKNSPTSSATTQRSSRRQTRGKGPPRTTDARR